MEQSLLSNAPFINSTIAGPLIPMFLQGIIYAILVIAVLYGLEIEKVIAYYIVNIMHVFA